MIASMVTLIVHVRFWKMLKEPGSDLDDGTRRCWQIIMPLDFREFSFILSLRYIVEEDPVPDGDVGWEGFSHLHLAALLGSGAFSALDFQSILFHMITGKL